MYIPSYFSESRLETLHDVIRNHGFATLVSFDGAELIASHIPFVLDADRGLHGTLLTHVARPNPQWRSLTGEREAMAIFQGPHAYVSPTWYVNRPNVPTWNYVAVHVYGRPRAIDARPEVIEILNRTVEMYDHHGWTTADLPPEYFQGHAGGVVGIEIPIARIEGKFKLNQNRSPADRAGVIAALGQSPNPNDAAVAELMKKL